MISETEPIPDGPEVALKRPSVVARLKNHTPRLFRYAMRIVGHFACDQARSCLLALYSSWHVRCDYRLGADCEALAGTIPSYLLAILDLVGSQPWKAA